MAEAEEGPRFPIVSTTLTEKGESEMAPMTKMLSLALATMLITAPARSEEMTETERLTERNAELEQRLKYIEAAYGKAPKNLPSGEVGDLDNYSALVQSRVVPLSLFAASELSTQLASPKCQTRLLVSGSFSSVHLAKYREVRNKLDGIGKLLSFGGGFELLSSTDMNANMKAAIGAPALDAALVSGLAGTLVNLVGLFQVNYEPKSVDLVVPTELVLARLAANTTLNAMLVSAPRLGPSRIEQDAQALVVLAQLRLGAAESKLKEASGAAAKKKAEAAVAEAKKVVADLAEVYGALVKIDANGLAPLDYIRPYEDLALDVSGTAASACVVAVASHSPGGLALSRESIFGKGGKVYAMVSLTMTAVQYGPQGDVLNLGCAQVEETATIDVKRLTKGDDKSVAWGGATATYCGYPPLAQPAGTASTDASATTPP